MKVIPRLAFGNHFRHATIKDADGNPALCVVTETRHELVYWREVNIHRVGFFEVSATLRNVIEVL